jgi:dTDP-4-amino-4,6-dideoxygalactose transaminase
MKRFSNPVYISRPALPEVSDMTRKIQEIWDSKWVTNVGDQHKLLENRLIEYLKAPYLSLFNNGTIALITACRALRLTGEVITTPFTFPATPHVLTWNNVKPIFCDIDPLTLNIDAAKIESMITPNTTAILAVHVFGTPCDVVEIQRIADRYGLRVVYDAAHAFGVEIDGVGIGEFGDISMFSFHGTKLFHTAEGGALSCKDQNMKQRIDYLKNFGIKNEEEVVMPGINGKMNEIQAALGLLVLDIVETEISKRKVLIDVYRSMLKGVEGISVNEDSSGAKKNYQYFTIRINDVLFGCSRDEAHKHLKEHNVYTRKYFYPLCSNYQCYKYLPSSSPANLPVAETASKEILCLPLYGELTETDIKDICEILLDARKKN